MRAVSTVVCAIATLMCVIGLLGVVLLSAYLLKLVDVGLVLIGLGVLRIDQARRQHDAMMAALGQRQSVTVAPTPQPRGERTVHPAQPRPKRIDELLEQVDNH